MTVVIGADGGMSRVSPRWEHPQTVASFTTGGPNEVLVAWSERFRGASRPRCLDIGCGAARNAVALAALGFRVVGTDLSRPMLVGAQVRLEFTPLAIPIDLVLAPMAPLPFADGLFDLVVAHGIWNLARSGAEFKAAVAEAARVARPGAGLFLFTFSRNTLPPDAPPDAGESFVYSSWSGEPHCFLTETEVVTLLAAAGFERDTPGPLSEYNAPGPGEARMAGGPPVIYEGTFVRR
jgi:SAM-dependent methyltransferase